MTRGAADSRPRKVERSLQTVPYNSLVRWREGAFQEFLDWCLAYEGDHREFEAALRSVPNGSYWIELASALLDELADVSEHAPRDPVPGQPIIHDTIDTACDLRRREKRLIVEAEIARRPPPPPA